MQRCAKCPSINLTDQEIDDQYNNTSPLICFRIYHLIARCSTHRRLLLNDRKIVVSVNMILLQKNPQRYTLEKS